MAVTLRVTVNAITTRRKLSFAAILIRALSVRQSLTAACCAKGGKGLPP
jgi:hypothetical protein